MSSIRRFRAPCTWPRRIIPRFEMSLGTNNRMPRCWRRLWAPVRPLRCVHSSGNAVLYAGKSTGRLNGTLHSRLSSPDSTFNVHDGEKCRLGASCRLDVRPVQQLVGWGRDQPSRNSPGFPSRAIPRGPWDPISQVTRWAPLLPVERESPVGRGLSDAIASAFSAIYFGRTTSISASRGYDDWRAPGARSQTRALPALAVRSNFTG